jgi:DNA-binding MarR family transcriptional regulator
VIEEMFIGLGPSSDNGDEWNSQRPVSRVFRNIMLISRFCNEVIEQTAKKHGLQPGEFLVVMTLMRVGGNEGLRPTELYNQLLVTSGAITKRIDRLDEMGLIERLTSKRDRRSSPVRLTAKGLKIGQLVRTQRNKLHTVADALGSENLQELDQMLLDYLNAIEQVADQENT